MGPYNMIMFLMDKLQTMILEIIGAKETTLCQHEKLTSFHAQVSQIDQLSTSNP